MTLNKTTSDCVLIWLVFTGVSSHCGKKAVTRRLVEWNPVTKKLVYAYPLENKRTVPNDGFLNGKPYYRGHQLNPNPLHQKEFINACNQVGAIPRGVKVS